MALFPSMNSLLSITICLEFAHSLLSGGSQSVTGMTAMFSQVKSSGQSYCTFDESWVLSHWCGTLNFSIRQLLLLWWMTAVALFFFTWQKCIRYTSLCACSGTSQTQQSKTFPTEIHRKCGHTMWISHSVMTVYCIWVRLCVCMPVCLPVSLAWYVYWKKIILTPW